MPMLLLPGLVVASEDSADVMEPLDCVINPSVVSDLGSAVPGVLREIRVDRSDFVEQGDVIAQLESGVELAVVELARTRAEVTAEVDLRRVNAAFGRRQHERSEGLFQRKVISTNDIDERETEARLAQLQLRQALDNQKIAKLELVRAVETLGRRTVASPLKGVVMERFKSVGEYVEDQPIVRVAQLDPLYVEVIVPVEKLGMVREGMQANVWADAVGGYTWPARVVRVDRVADVASGTYGVRLELPNPDYQIPAGLRCRVQLTRTEATVEESYTPVPQEAPPEQQKAAPEPTAPKPAVGMLRTAEDETAALEPATAATVDTAAEQRELDSKMHVAAEAVTSAPEPTDVADDAVATADLMPMGNLQMQLPECRLVGPFARQADARQHADALRQQGLAVKVENRIVKVQVGHQVVMLPEGGKSGAEQLVAKMQAAGVRDLYMFVNKEGTPKISLGLYKNQAPAERRVDELARKGFDAELAPWKKSLPQSFLAIHGISNDTARELLAGLPVPDTSIAPVDGACERIAGR